MLALPRRRVLLALAGFAAFAVFGASSQASLAQDAATQALAGRWRVTRIGGDPIAARHAPMLELRGREYGGKDGCNVMRGTLTHLDGRAIAFGDAATTRMACPPPIMGVADRFHAALRSARGYRVARGGLRLTDAQGGVVVVARRAR